MNQTRVAAAAIFFVLAGPATAASPLDGCWKMVDARIERQNGKVDTPASDCIRAYQGATLVTACRGGHEVSVYALTDMSVSTYSFAQTGRLIDGKELRVEASTPRAAAYRVIGPTLHMVLGKTAGIVRAEQRLARLPAKECAALARFLQPAAGAQGAK